MPKNFHQLSKSPATIPTMPGAGSWVPLEEPRQVSAAWCFPSERQGLEAARPDPPPVVAAGPPIFAPLMAAGGGTMPGMLVKAAERRYTAIL